MAGSHTLAETERQVVEKLGSQPIDFDAMAVISNVFRASSAVRNHLGRTVLLPNDLSWTAFVVLWVTWIWEEPETREVAEESGISKATLTGILKTLEKRGLVKRTKSSSDGRLVLVSLTKSGKSLMSDLFPKFNSKEVALASIFRKEDQVSFAENLRLLTVHAQRL